MSFLCWRIAVLLAVASAENVAPSCSSQVYCQGQLLHTVQMASLYDDSKTFVDMKMKNSETITMQNFNALMERTGNKPTRDQVEDFVNDNFEEGRQLEVVNPEDWVENPAFLSGISDPDFKQWAKDLNLLWKNLSRKIPEEVREESDRYSLLYVPHPFVIPGGRFRELYYWDTYWIVRGLLISNMTTTVKGILDNFLYMMDNYGIIPNGGRVYYLMRSQPPMLTPMVANYYRQTNDLAFVQQNIDTLENEFNFWMKNRTTEVTKNGKTYTLARYYSVSEGPRPESYREDYEEAHRDFDNDERRQEFYVDLKSAAESGWDFSGRWFIKNGTNNGKLTDIHTQHIIPVDLNAFLYWNADILSNLFKILGKPCKSQYYAEIAAKLKEAVTAVLWDEDEGSWFDYDTINNKSRKYFYPSNIAPLWTKCYDEANVASIALKVVGYLKKNNILDYLGGIPTSVVMTGEQWDLPNAWPPLQSIIVQGLEETKQTDAVQMAYEFTEHWVRSNYKGYEESKEMYEKYDAENPGRYGGGGEYTVQTGFGWTNGVALEMLHSHGATLTSSNNNVVRKRSLLELLSPPSSK